MARQILTDAFVEAARRVIANWNDGDLAGAVRELCAALEEYDASIIPGDVVRSVETGECFVVIAPAENDGDEDMVEVLGIYRYAMLIDGQSLQDAIEHDNRQWFAVNDIAFVRTSGIPSDRLAGWSRPFVPPKGHLENRF